MGAVGLEDGGRGHARRQVGAPEAGQGRGWLPSGPPEEPAPPHLDLSR